MDSRNTTVEKETMAHSVSHTKLQTRSRNKEARQDEWKKSNKEKNVWVFKIKKVKHVMLQK